MSYLPVSTLPLIENHNTFSEKDQSLVKCIAWTRSDIKKLNTNFLVYDKGNIQEYKNVLYVWFQVNHKTLYFRS